VCIFLCISDVYKIDNDRLLEHDIYKIPETKSGPRHILFHPKFNILYILNELSLTLHTISFSSSTLSSSKERKNFDHIIITTER